MTRLFRLISLFAAFILVCFFIDSERVMIVNQLVIFHYRLTSVLIILKTAYNIIDLLLCEILFV